MRPLRCSAQMRRPWSVGRPHIRWETLCRSAPSRRDDPGSYNECVRTCWLISSPSTNSSLKKTHRRLLTLFKLYIHLKSLKLYFYVISFWISWSIQSSSGWVLDVSRTPFVWPASMRRWWSPRCWMPMSVKPRTSRKKFFEEPPAHCLSDQRGCRGSLLAGEVGLHSLKTQ